MKAIKNAFVALILLISSSSMSGYDLAGKSNAHIYLHTDRPYYISGESILFKAYIFDTPKEKTIQDDTLRVTLIDQEGIAVAIGQFPLENSLINGKIDLPEILSEGNYMLLAFTTKNKILSPERIFSKVIEIRKSENPVLSTDLSLADTLYQSGSTVNAQIKFTGGDDKPVAASFNYLLTSEKGEILSGKNKAGNDGKVTLKLKLPEFDNKENFKLTIDPSYKGNPSVTGIIIPTPYNYIARKRLTSVTDISAEQKHLNIQLSTLNLQDEKVQLNIAVTDDQGKPVMANLSVSASNNLGTIDNDNADYISIKERFPELNTIPDITDYYSKLLIQITQEPGKQFVVQKKNDIKKLRRKDISSQKKQEGYSADRNIMDIIMQIKPYHIDNGKITFGISSVNTINGQEGALIIIDGVKMGTDIGVLTNLSVPDIAHISVSTNIMDIQRYSAMNNVGVIEITMKKNKSFENKEETTVSNSHTLFWGPDIITDNSGKVTLNFPDNNKSESLLISVDGITAKGLTGSKTQIFKVN